MTNFERRAFLKNSIALALSSSSMFAMAGSAIAARIPDDNVRSFLQSGKRSIDGIPLRHKDKLQRIYAERNYIPVWSIDGQYTNTTRAVLRKLDNSSLLGLHPSHYYTKVLNSWLHLQEPQTASRLEILLTDSLYEYFDNLANGQSGEKPGDDGGWFLKQAKTNVHNYVMNFFRGDASFRQTIDNLQPLHHRYTGLLVALQDHHRLFAEGGFQTVDPGPTLKPGMRSPRVAQLRNRLMQSGDITDNYASAPDQYDWLLEEGLKTFQQRHGLDADGLLGGNTLKELNVPIEHRIAQIEVNLDRWRWLPSDLGNSHLTVNTAGFELDVVLDGYSSLHMNVVVGKPEHRTPIFSDRMEHLVFNPSWHVPVSITKNELLPKERANPGYLENKNFVAVSLADKSSTAISSLSTGELESSYFISRYRLQQLPGENNALGSVKFMLPNQYSIYLHDTNAKSLFEKTSRAYSHGCVRLEDPHHLAKTILAHDGHDPSRVDSILESGRSKTINLNAALPVHMTYQTSWVDESGKINFRKDIYSHDAHAIQTYQYQRPRQAQREAQILASLSSYASNEF